MKVTYIVESGISWIIKKPPGKIWIKYKTQCSGLHLVMTCYTKVLPLPRTRHLICSEGEPWVLVIATKWILLLNGPMIADVATAIGSWCTVTVLPHFLNWLLLTLPASLGAQGGSSRMAWTIEASGNLLTTFPLWSNHHILPSIRMWRMWEVQCVHSGVLGAWCLQRHSTVER